MSDNYEGRPGPPLWLGLVVMLLLPLFVFGIYGFTITKSIDIKNLITIPNGTSTVLPGDRMYVVLAPDRGRQIGACTITNPAGVEAVQEVPPANQQQLALNGRRWRAATAVITGDTGGYTVKCKQAGKELVVIPFKASMTELKWRTLATYIFAGGSFVAGLLMIVFRRKKPKYSGLQMARATSRSGPPPPPTPAAPPTPASSAYPSLADLPPPTPSQYADRGPGSY